MGKTAKTEREIKLFDVELIEVLTKKTYEEVLSEYTVPELNRLAGVLLFFRFV